MRLALSLSLALLMSFLTIAPAAAGDVHAPPKGSPLRASLLDAARPAFEQEVGAPPLREAAGVLLVAREAAGAEDDGRLVLEGQLPPGGGLLADVVAARGSRATLDVDLHPEALRAGGRGSFGGVRGVFAGEPCRAHSRLRFQDRADRRRGLARRQTAHGQAEP